MSAERFAHTPPLPCAPGVDALRYIVSAYARDPSAVPDDPLRALARVISEDARMRGFQIEALLVSLKRTWPVLIDGQEVSRLASSRLLARVVSLCVEEYYAP